MATQSPTVELAQVHESGAWRIAFDPGSQRIASGGYRGGIKIWSAEDGVELSTLDAHKNRITGLAWLDDQQVISVDSSGLLVVNDIDTRQQVSHTQLPGAIDMVIAPDRSWVLILHSDGIDKLVLPALERVAGYHFESPLTAAISRSGRRVAVSAVSGQVFLLDEDLRQRVELERPSRKARDLVFSPDEGVLLAGGWFRLLMWQLDSGVLREIGTQHLGKVNSVDISPDGARWVSLGRDTDSQFLLYNASSLQVERRLKTHELCGQRARFSPDGRYVASSSDDGSVHIYDLDEPYQPTVPYLEAY